MIRTAQRRFAPTAIGILRNRDRHQFEISDRHHRNPQLQQLLRLSRPLRSTALPFLARHFGSKSLENSSCLKSEREIPASSIRVCRVCPRLVNLPPAVAPGATANRIGSLRFASLKPFRELSPCRVAPWIRWVPFCVIRLQFPTIPIKIRFTILVPLYLREWERQESDNQTNFFFEGSPSHMASLKLYRGLLSALIAFASGSSVTVVVRGAATGGSGDFQL